MTVHKSQGSEFDHAALIFTQPTFAGRDAGLRVYTAVTRARRQLSLYADERIWQARLTRTGGAAKLIPYD